MSNLHITGMSNIFIAGMSDPNITGMSDIFITGMSDPNITGMSNNDEPNRMTNTISLHLDETTNQLFC